MTVVALLAVFSAVLSWKDWFSFQNNVLTTVLAVVGVFGFVGRALVWIVSRLHAPIGFAFSVTYLPEDPEAIPKLKYRYVRPRSGSVATNRNLLRPYVAFSGGDLAIAGAHADLTIEGRYALYERWFQINPAAFLSLEKRNWLGNWKPIAVSILLPLTVAGREKLSTGQVEVLGLNEFYIASTGVKANVFLIDTLIVKRWLQGRNRGYGFPGLTIKHIADLWDASPDAWFLIEPDSTRLTKKLLEEPLRFKKAPPRQGNESELYEFHYENDIVGEKVTKLYEQLVGNINKCRSWRIYEVP
jgi:hypothetical protein